MAEDEGRQLMEGGGWHLSAVRSDEREVKEITWLTQAAKHLLGGDKAWRREVPANGVRSDFAECAPDHGKFVEISGFLEY